VNPSSDIHLFTTTLPFPVLVSRTMHLRRTFPGYHPRLRMMTLRVRPCLALIRGGADTRPCYGSRSPCAQPARTPSRRQRRVPPPKARAAHAGRIPAAHLSDSSCVSRPGPRRSVLPAARLSASREPRTGRAALASAGSYPGEPALELALEPFNVAGVLPAPSEAEPGTVLAVPQVRVVARWISSWRAGSIETGDRSGRARW
jgi:hypothetical protein